MAGYGYGYRGYSTYNTPSSDDWGKTSYAPDHLCRPVIIDAEGRKRPIISYGADQNADHYECKTETIFQQRGHIPLESEYKHGARWTDDPYGAENKFHRGGLTSVNGRPQFVEEFITKVQTQASRPTAGPWDASCRRQTPKFTGYDGYTDGYDEHNGFHNKDLLKSNGNAHRNDYYDDYYRKQGSNREPNTIASGGPGGWARPSHSTWAAPHNASLSGATNDISAAVGLLKEAAKPSGPQSRYWEPTYPETIDSKEVDSKEAARRYGNLNFFSRPYARDDSYTSTIDSREAARKYSGSAV